MSDGKYRMIPEHPGACESHDLFDLRAQFRFVTMDRTSAAGRLVFLIRTTCEPLPGIGNKGTAGIAETPCPVMMGAAVESHHGLYGSSLVVHSGASGIHRLEVLQFFQYSRTDILLA
jgi:hypothetical protein